MGPLTLWQRLRLWLKSDGKPHYDSKPSTPYRVEFLDKPLVIEAADLPANMVSAGVLRAVGNCWRYRSGNYQVVMTYHRMDGGFLGESSDRIFLRPGSPELTEDEIHVLIRDHVISLFRKAVLFSGSSR